VWTTAALDLFQLLHMQPARRGRRARCIQLKITLISVEITSSDHYSLISRQYLNSLHNFQTI
jgi:hypothetical protein